LAAHSDHFRNVSKVIGGKSDVRCFNRDIGASGANGYADVGGRQSGRVIHAVANHTEPPARRPQELDRAQLVFGHETRMPLRHPGCSRDGSSYGCFVTREHHQPFDTQVAEHFQCFRSLGTKSRG